MDDSFRARESVAPRDASVREGGGAGKMCLWCGGPLPGARNRGSARRFCRPDCRMAFHSAARRYVNRAISDGRLSVAELNGPRKACSLVSGAISGVGATQVAKTARSRLVSPVRVCWAGYDPDALAAHLA